MRIIFSFLLILIPGILLGQNNAVSKRKLLAAIKNADQRIESYKDRPTIITWDAQNENNSFYKADTIIFYNFSNSPGIKCNNTSWEFYGTKFLNLVEWQRCKEPPTGTIKPDGRDYYSVSLLKKQSLLFLRIANRFNLVEYYKILSINETQPSDERFAYSKITLVRLHGINNL